MKSGWDCPGYGKTWKFVQENRQLAQFYRNKNYDLEELVSDPVSTSSELNSEYPLVTVGPGDLEMYKLQEVGITAFYEGVLWPLYSDSERIGLLFSHVLSRRKGAALYALQTLGGFLSYIPSRLGRNIALDKSIVCLCSVYMNFTEVARRNNFSDVTIKGYAESLYALQQCLNNIQARYQSETVCASIILQLCEVSAWCPQMMQPIS